MKKFLYFFCATAMVLSLGLSSCVKEDPARPLEVDLSKTATVQGRILFNTDLTLTEPVLTAPSAANVTITARINYSSIVNGGSGVHIIQNITYNASTGDFTIQVPVSEWGGTVTISINDFTGTQRQQDFSVTPTSTIVRNGRWSGTISSPFVAAGETVILPTTVLGFTRLDGVGDPAPSH